MVKKNIEFVISGGGTAGHTNPGIAVAQALVECGIPKDHIHFVGGLRGNEGKLVPDAGFEITLLPGRGIQRKFTLQNFSSAYQLLKGTMQGISLIRKMKPKALLCLGGYASLPASIGAIIFRVPIVVSEQNAKSSAVNRFVARFAKVCALPFPDTDLPKGVITGNPIRNNIVRQSESMISKDREKFGVSENKKFVAVWSGSLGAQSVNNAVADLAQIWKERDDIFIYQVVGKRDWDKFKDNSRSNYQTIAYENDMPTLLNAADICICRAGASTIAELSVVGLPSVLVPLPYAPRDHQRANSKELENVGGAVVLEDSDLSGQLLADTLDGIFSKPNKLSDMRKSTLKVSRPDAAEKVAKLLIDQERK